MNKLLLSAIFVVTLSVIIGTEEAFAVTKTYVGLDFGDWEDANNWNPAGVPNQNDDVIIVGPIFVDINSDVTVGSSGSITTSGSADLNVLGPSGSLTIFGTHTMTENDDIFIRDGGTVTVQCGGLITMGAGMIFVPRGDNGATLINHGTITGTTAINIQLNPNGLFQNSGILTAGVLNEGGNFQTIPSICEIVGGEIIPIDSTALLLAGVQTPMAWMVYTFSAIGIGAFLFTRNPNNMRNIKVILRDYLDRF